MVGAARESGSFQERGSVMSSKLFAVATALAVLASVGCTGVFVPKTQYDRDVNQLREYNAALERDNAQLRPIKDAYDRLKAQSEFTTDSNQAWEEMAEALKKALDGIAVEPGDFTFDRKTGAFVFAADLLFDSGCYDISAKGKEALRKFAEMNRGAHLRIVGHTDAAKVVKASTKSKLPVSDTNMELSALRAVAVMHELIRNGIAERNMWVEGKGATEPRDGGLNRCRRVEIFVVGGTTSAPAPRASTGVKAAHKTVNK